MIKNRIQAGKLLAEKIKDVDKENTIVLAIPRGGVVVGYQIAKKIGCVLDVAISKKITPLDNPEYAIGAITSDGTIYQGKNWKYYSDSENFEDEISKKKTEALRRLEEYRGNDKYQLEDKTIILVDDGIATGSTVFAILNWLIKQKVQRTILVIPVMPAETLKKLQDMISEIIVLQVPKDFGSVGQFYHQFEQVSDAEVKNLLSEFRN